MVYTGGMSSNAKAIIKVVSLCVVLVVSIAALGGHLSQKEAEGVIERVEYFEGEVLEVFDEYNKDGV